MKNYILDTSAILALVEDEAGSEDVEKLLLEAVEGKILIFVSIVTVIESIISPSENKAKKSLSKD